MSRGLTTAAASAVAAEVAITVYLVELQFSGGTLYLTTAPHDLAVTTTQTGAQTWSGVGGALSFDSVQESGDLSANGLQLTISGVEQTILAALLSDGYLGRLARIWLCYLATDGTVSGVAGPFAFRMNGAFTAQEVRPEAVGEVGTVTIQARLTDLLGDLDQTRGIQANLATHQAIYPGDTGMAYVPGLVNKRITWGKR